MREGPVLCVTCPAGRAREPLSASLTCGPCRDQLDTRLGEIGARYGRLSAMPEARGLDGTPRAPGFESRVPGSAHVWALRDRRSIPGRGPDGVFAAPAILEFYADVIAGQRGAGVSSDRTVSGLVAYVRRHLEWVGTQAYVVDLAEDVRRCCDQLRAATGEPNPKPVGYCYAALPDDRGGHVICEQPLFAPRGGGTLIRCRACAAEYDGTELIRLALEAQARKDAS